MAKFCPNCGNPVEEGAAFCGRCGQPFNAVVPPPAGAYAPRPESINPVANARGKKKLKKFLLIPAAALLLAVVLVTGFRYPGWIRLLSSDIGPAGDERLEESDIVGQYRGKSILSEFDEGTVSETDEFHLEIVSVDGVLNWKENDLPLKYNTAANTWHGTSKSKFEDRTMTVTVKKMIFRKNPDGSTHLSGVILFDDWEKGSILPSRSTFTLELDSASSE